MTPATPNVPVTDSRLTTTDLTRRAARGRLGRAVRAPMSTAATAPSSTRVLGSEAASGAADASRVGHVVVEPAGSCRAPAPRPPSGELRRYWRSAGRPSLDLGERSQDHLGHGLGLRDHDRVGALDLRDG